MSESELIEKIARYRRNNGLAVDENSIREEIWVYLCSREPHRCGGGAPAVGAAGAGLPLSLLVSVDKTPELQGPPIWLFLNTLAAQWSPGLHPYFLATCDAIVVILECPKCREEWRRLLVAYSPKDLSSRLAVCQWVNLVHNQVNERRGKAAYPYSDMVTQFGAPTA